MQLCTGFGGNLDEIGEKQRLGRVNDRGFWCFEARDDARILVPTCGSESHPCVAVAIAVITKRAAVTSRSSFLQLKFRSKSQSSRIRRNRSGAALLRSRRARYRASHQ